MRISELSRASGVPLPTIKFYLREGLLPAGSRSAPNQAAYDASHLRRLRLIRVLVEIGGLGVAAVREVLRAADRDDITLHAALAAAHTALRDAERPRGPGHDEARTATDAWLAALGWEVDLGSPGRDDLAAALAALRALGWQVGPEVFDRYARAADLVAAEEIDFVARTPDRQSAVETTVIGTVVFERALAALRRLAQERHSATRLGTAEAARAPGRPDRRTAPTARASRSTSSPSRSRR
jgi:DNA-binding transcriptional MerR regulator